jgi:toxin ParE1/3/4
MSDLRYVLELSDEAYDDLIDIQNYTLLEYGESQMEKYSDILEQALEHILYYPLSGHSRIDVPEKYLTWQVEEHILIYRVENNIIYLVRVLHKKMNFLKWLV